MKQFNIGSKEKKCNIQIAYWRTILKHSMQALRNVDCIIGRVFWTLSLFEGKVKVKKNLSLRFYTAKMTDWNKTQQLGKSSRSSCSKTPTHHIVATLVIHIWNSIFIFFFWLQASLKSPPPKCCKSRSFFVISDTRHSFFLFSFFFFCRDVLYICIYTCPKM